MDASDSTSWEKTDAIAPVSVEPERVVQLLLEGRLELVGQILSSSNVIFLVSVTGDDVQTLAVYKPHRGERPLWDFPQGTLCLREVAAYVVSRALGWPLIPPTVLRDGPHGIGALQLFIDADPEATYFSLCEEREADLFPVALFDILANNADRKGGHLLLDEWDRIWAIDNALTFHVEPKLRTVIWDFAGEPIPEAYQADLRELQEQLTGEGSLRETLAKLLAEEEIAALNARLATLLENPVLPHSDPSRRQVPWPLV
jgi:uncharacterized repeat protein (TIGR03843 family)